MSILLCGDFKSVKLRTNNHHIEVETLAHTFAVPLVGEVGKPDIASQLSSNNVLVLRRNWRGGNCMFKVSHKILSLYDGPVEHTIRGRSGRSHWGLGSV
jgi:hypothetical protein